MKVAVFIYSLGRGGAEKVALEITKGLKEREDWEIELVLIHDRIGYPLPSGVNVHILQKKEPATLVGKVFSSIALAKTFASFCRERQVDSVLAILGRPNLISILSKYFGNKARIVLSEHTSQTLWRRDEVALTWLKRQFLSRVYNRSDQVVCVSKRIKHDLESHFGVRASLLEVIYNPFDLTRIQEMADQESGTEPNRDGKIIFITAGTLYPVKNHGMLIEAFSRLEKENAELWILGDGEMRGDLEELIRKYRLEQRVHLLGFRDNPYCYMKAADVFVLSSNNEGLPNVLIEALACGCTVVSTDCVSGPREILAPASDFLYQMDAGMEEAEYGILTPVKNTEMLAKAMKYLLDYPEVASRYRSKAKERVEEFGDGIIEKYSRVLASE